MACCNDVVSKVLFWQPVLAELLKACLIAFAFLHFTSTMQVSFERGKVAAMVADYFHTHSAKLVAPSVHVVFCFAASRQLLMSAPAQFA